MAIGSSGCTSKEECQRRNWKIQGKTSRKMLIVKRLGLIT
jgi:hypothetical protein